MSQHATLYSPTRALRLRLRNWWRDRHLCPDCRDGYTPDHGPDEPPAPPMGHNSTSQPLEPITTCPCRSGSHT